MSNTKSFNISKRIIWEAWLSVKRNAGSAGIDAQSIKNFEVNLEKNLYKLWNRMSSGSYFPPPVRMVEIPKKAGGKRVLGIPTVGDRVCQTAVKLMLEPEIDKVFYQDSFGYRPSKSAHDAIEVTRKRCWEYDWVLEFDIRTLFDNIPHDLLLKALRHHTDCKWILLYVERWLTASMEEPNGNLIIRDKGTPQGGVVSPILSNLFMHYAFDHWISTRYPNNPWCRYADDGLVHCKSEQEAKHIMDSLKHRLTDCGIELHPEKSKIVYCKDSSRLHDYQHTHFEFLGYEFKKRLARNRARGNLFLSFSPAVSRDTLRNMRMTLKHGNRVAGIQIYTVEKVAALINPKIRGWLQYYGKFTQHAMRPLAVYVNEYLVRWAMRKFKKLRNHKTRAFEWLTRIHNQQPKLFAHWEWFKMY